MNKILLLSSPDNDLASLILRTCPDVILASPDSKAMPAGNFDALCILGGDRDGKVRKLMDYTAKGGDVADPWYSDRFDVAYRDIEAGCRGLLEELIK